MVFIEYLMLDLRNILMEFEWVNCWRGGFWLLKPPQAWWSRVVLSNSDCWYGNRTKGECSCLISSVILLIQTAKQNSVVWLRQNLPSNGVQIPSVLHAKNAPSCGSVYYKNGGERGIRTPGSFRNNGFQDRRIRPLCHLSTVKLECESHMRLIGRVNVRFQSNQTNAHKCKKIPGFLRGLTLPNMNFYLPIRKKRSSRMRTK